MLSPLGAAIATVAGPIQAAQAAPPPTTPDQKASAQARTTGKAVPVVEDTTPYTDTVANPDGSFTFTANRQPQRARKGNSWVTPDATLHRNPDGSLAPAASVAALTLSGGGTQPLATFDDHAGHVLSVSMPMRLPSPVLSGPAATYRDVLPGVDLAVTATVDGGMSEVLVVHDAAAAANPALASLTMATHTTGLTLTTDPTTGAITATDPSTGKPVFAAPPPLMWDSSTPTDAEAKALEQRRRHDPLDAVPLTSTVQNPGAGAQVTRVPTHGSADQITLAPPATALTGASVRYPVFIDPSWSVASNPDAYTQSFHQTTTAYNPTDNLRTGYDDWTTNCGSPCYQNGITRSYLVYSLKPMVGKYIHDAHLQLTEVGSSDSSTSNYYTVQVSDTSPWDSSLDWANQPGFGAVTDQANIPGVAPGTSSQWQISVTDMIRYAFNSGWTGIYMVMHMGDEQNDMKYKHWGLNPQLVVTYWSTPDQPKITGEANGGKTYPCDTTSPGTWIPAATNNRINMNYTVSSVDTNTSMAANTWVSTNGGSYTEYVINFTYTSGNYPISQPLTVVDGASYAWYAQTNNPYVSSPVSATCYFRYDATSPTAPSTFTSTDYPANGPTTVTSGGSGTISWAGATDTGSGVAGYNYNVNGTSISSGGSPGSTTATSLSIPLSSLHWGTNTLWLQSKDNAGNLSTPVAYNFYVQQSAFGAYTPGTAGDIDGDNNADLVTVDAAGNIRMFSHPDAVSVNPSGDTTADPLQYGGKVLIPSNQDSVYPSGTFAGAFIGHAGSFTGKNADDLIIIQNGNLAVAQNSYGNGTTWAQSGAIPKPLCAACTNYDSADWSSVIQMTAVPNGPGARPDLLTVEFWSGVTQVWLYTPTSTGIGFNDNPTLIATDHANWYWEDNQIVAAQPLPGLTGSTLVVRNALTCDLQLIPNITAGSTDPATQATLVTSSATTSTSPRLTAGPADQNGDWPVWSADSDGRLHVTQVHTDTSGTTTWNSGGNSVALSDPNWSHREIALGSMYTAYKNIAIVNDASTAPSAFDGGSMSYSAQALSEQTALQNGATSACPDTWTNCAGGVAAGQWLVTASGDVFTMPARSPGTGQAWTCWGHPIPVPVTSSGSYADHIAFLGAATTTSNTGATGTATVTFTDGRTQQIPITLSDWTLGNNAWSPAGGNTIVASTTYRDNITTGAQDAQTTYLFSTVDTQLLDNGQTLDIAGVAIASITLPDNSAIKILAIAVG